MTGFRGAEVMRICDELNHLRIFIKFFNTTGSSPIYSLKVLFTIVGTSNGCFAIMMISQHPVMAAFAGFVSVATSAIFSILYERAFFVAELMKGANLHVRQAVNQARDIDGPMKKYVRKRMESVPATGIKLANFGTFERPATPTFLDFVVPNAAGLLLSLQFSRD